ncbi:MAG: DNA gyrase subunit A [Candidatus Nealsonbacteria bacterium]
MKESYIDYAMSVIVSRALPDVRDGLKPVHRRILYSMYKMGLFYNVKFRKSATVVGNCMGRYHPHGDAAIYDSLVRMAQDFSLRYPLVIGQGNFGCFTKDTKVKLTDGRSLTFGQLIKEYKQGKKNYTFTFNSQDKIIEIAEIKKPRLTRKNEKLIEVILDNEKKIRCTLNHKFMLRNGTYREAQNLKAGDSLMALDINTYNLNKIQENFHQKTADNQTVFGESNSEWNFSLSSYNQYSKPETFVKLLNQKTVEVGRIAPPDSWMISQSPHYATPTAFSLYHSCKKVNKIEILKEREDVYDLTIESWHNFLLDAGVFVHNSIDADPAASMRYTECKLSKIGGYMMKDIEKNTVDFRDNYDSTTQEPIVTPSPLPQLLLNGSLGIAVGMTTNIPPHNLSEVCDALTYLIDNEGNKVTTEDLFKFIQGPDFPLGGIIYGKKDIIEAYSSGKGPIIARGKAEIKENDKSGISRIIISEIPYQVQKSSLVEQLAKLVQDKKIIGIKDIRDESDRDGMRIMIEVQKAGYPQKILNRIYKFTDLQKTFHLNMIALAEGIQPRVLGLADVLNYFIDHRKQVVLRRTKFNLDKAKERVHILEGLHKCLSKIDIVIKIIKSSKNREDAQKNLMKKFKLSEIQANAILETKLAALAKLERQKIEDELKELLGLIKEYMSILKSPKRIKEIIKKELKEIKENFGDERRTKVMVQKVGEIAEEDLIPKEETIITLTQGGYIKRINPSIYKIQKRGGKGILGMKTLQEDIIEHFLLSQTHDSLFFFTDSGKVFRTLVYEIPEASRVARGRGLLNFLELSSDEKVLSLITIDKKDVEFGIKNLLMITKNGIIKKTALDGFKNVRKSGLIAIKLRKDDLLNKVVKSTGDDEIIIVTKKGQSIKFNEKEIREMGRTASGIKGIGLKKGDEVVGMGVIKNQKSKIKNQNEEGKEGKEEKQHLLVVMKNGYGKRTDVKEYRLQGRGGTGIKTANITPKTGELVYSKVLDGQEEDLIIISQQGQVIRINISSIPKLSRATQGVRIMRLGDGDKVASAMCM